MSHCAYCHVLFVQVFAPLCIVRIHASADNYTVKPAKAVLNVSWHIQAKYNRVSLLKCTINYVCYCTLGKWIFLHTTISRILNLFRSSSERIKLLRFRLKQKNRYSSHMISSMNYLKLFALYIFLQSLSHLHLFRICV